MNTLFIANAVTGLICGILCLIFVVCILVSEGTKNKLNRVFITVLLFNAGFMLSDALSFYSIGRTEPPYFFIFNAIGCFFSLVFSYVVIFCFSNYIYHYFSTKTTVVKIWRNLSFIICTLGIFIACISLGNNMIYFIDENNIYHRQGMFIFSPGLHIMGILTNSILIVKYRTYLNRLEKFALASYIILPIVGISIQMVFYGYVPINIASTMTLVFIYISMQAQHGRILKEKEVKIMESQIAIMLSQIQPHFLYNTLTTIETFCYKDPELAAKLVRDFSHYLRENMDSLVQKELVNFDRELEHIQIYVGIEKFRFGQRLNVVYDFETKDFMLPILTVQPLVENAVRYGLNKKLSGGTVTITTRRVPEGIKIIVADDGIGFDLNKNKKNDDRSHVGIENVRERLRAQCGGTLIVESEKDKGTICSIFIPQEGGSNE